MPSPYALSADVFSCLKPSLPDFRAAPIAGGVMNAVWRGSEMGHAPDKTIHTGFAALDAELPGGGWPCRSLTEILQPQPSLCEWRLLGRTLSGIASSGGQIVLVSPPKQPHLPGLLQHGLRREQLVWLDAQTPAERLWATEQLIKSNPGGAILSWLPQARPEQLRRLQVHAQSCEALVFLFRPAAAQLDASAAPLRLLVHLGNDWQLQASVFKRKGTPQEKAISLFSMTDSLAQVLPPGPPGLPGLPTLVTGRAATTPAFAASPVELFSQLETRHAGILGSPAGNAHPARFVSH